MNLIPKIKPIGIGDLEVVRQQLDTESDGKGYEDGEIAHIENIMANEYRKRSHRKLRQLEEFQSFEEDRSVESENHLETTERFELEKEIQKTVKSETKFEAGVEVSGGFGPVKFSAHAGFSTSSSNEEIQKESSNYAKEIIQKSVEKIKERVKQSKSTRILEEFEERNEHGFDNTGNNKHNIGEYRWQNKVYLTKVETLGKRLFYEFIIPQPSINYLYKEALKKSHRDLPIAPNKPHFYSINQRGSVRVALSIPLEPSKITSDNYQSIRINDKVVTGLNPPPSKMIVISKQAKADLPKNQDEDEKNFIINDQVKIPKGFKATKAYVALNSKSFNWLDSLALDFVIGRNVFKNESRRFIVSENLEFDLNEEIENLDFSLKYSYHLIHLLNFDSSVAQHKGPFSISANVEVECIPTTENSQKWQLEIYDTVMEEYRRQLLDYEEKISELEIQEGVQVGGNNSLINKEIIKNELKHSCIALYIGDSEFQSSLFQQDFEHGNSGAYPKIKVDESIENAKLIKFFETAFDWKNMTYELYPSFWSTNNVQGTNENPLMFSRSEIDSLKSEDPLFEEFLKAGSARVLLPIALESSLHLIAINIFGSKLLFYDNQEVFSMSMIELQEFFERNVTNMISSFEEHYEKTASYMDTQARNDFEKLLNELILNRGYYAELKDLLPTKDEIGIITPIKLPEESPDLSKDYDYKVVVPTDLVKLVKEPANANN